MSKLTMEQKVCRIVEFLVSGDMALDLEMTVATQEKGERLKLSAKDIRYWENIIGTIYRLTHVANNPPCIDAHDNWVKEVDRLYLHYRRKGYFQHLPKELVEQLLSKKLPNYK